MNHIFIDFQFSFMLHLLKKRCILLVILFCCALNTHAQITIHVQNEPIRSILKQIEHKSEYSFFYNDDMAVLGKKKSLSISNAGIDEVLIKLFAGTDLVYRKEKKNLIILALKGTGKQANKNGKSKYISGRVLDEHGEPIIGANVIEKGTNNGVISDMSGVFALTVDKQATLTVSFLGYETKHIAVRENTKLDIVLKEDVKLLDEILVQVAYGKQKKVSVTGSIVSTSGTELAKVPTISITNILAGRMPGLVSYTRSGEPGYDDAAFLIRGLSTTGDSSPLIVVDGVADRAGGFSRIDANDIEDVTILKDASAAIYGSRAANGVILITTKRGKSDKVTINYNGNIGFSNPTKLPEMCDSWQYAQLRNEIYTGRGQNPEYTKEEINIFKEGNDPANYPNIDLFNLMLRPAIQTQHNVSISGGNKIIRYYGSIGYQYQDNYYKNSASNYNQYSLRSNIDIAPMENLRIGVDIAARQEDRNSPVYNSEDMWRLILNYDPRINIVWPGTNYPTTPTKELFNPITAVDNTMGYTKGKTTYFNTDIKLHLGMPWITEGLSIDGGIYIDRSDTFWKKFEKKFSLYAKENNDYIARSYGPSNAKLNQNMGQSLGITLNARINYARTFSKEHYVSTFLAYECYNSRYDYMTAYRQDFISSNIDELFAGDKATATNDGSAYETARLNFFGHLDYEYKNRYLFQFNWRVDGSEKFPRKNRYGFFPGFSIGWRISEEPFWKKNIHFIDYLKLRGSWGQMGNDRVAPYQYMTTYTFASPGVIGGVSQSGISMNRSANANVAWEVASIINLGLEAKLFGDLNLELDFFKTKRDNILIQRSAAIPEYAGIKLPDENIGRCYAWGTEIILNYGKKLGNFTYSVGGNCSYAKNKVSYIDEPVSVLKWQKRTGKSIDVMDDYYNVMYVADGIFRTEEELNEYPHLGNTTVGDLRFVDVNKDGVINSKDKVRQDKPRIPRIMYGFNFDVSYKNWNLGLLFQGAAQVWQYTFLDAGLRGNFTKDFYNNRWTADHTNAAYPKTYDHDASVTGAGVYRNTFWLKNASYVRLKNIILSYSIPRKLLQSTPLSAIRLSLSGYNLLTFTGIKNIDPELSDNNQSYAAWETPQSKIVSFGINVTF